MIDFTKAAIKAMEKSARYDYFYEYDNLFIFEIKGNPEGSDAPSIIEKKSGDFSNHMKLLNENHIGWLDKSHMISEGSLFERLEKERSTSPTHSARYALEQGAIPKGLFDEGMSFMMSIVSKKNVLNKLLLDLLKEDDAENPYGENPIKVEPFRMTRFLVARIIFPEPEEEPLCYESYAFVDTRTEKATYFTVEKIDGEEEVMLCGCDKDGTHLNYGKSKLDTEELLKKMFKIIMDEMKQSETETGK